MKIEKLSKFKKRQYVDHHLASLAMAFRAVSTLHCGVALIS